MLPITKTGEIEKSDNKSTYEFFQNINNTHTHTQFIQLGAKSEALKFVRRHLNSLANCSENMVPIWYQ